MLEFLTEYIPFIPIFAGWNLLEYAWQFFAGMMLDICTTLNNMGSSMSEILIIKEGSFIGNIFHGLLSNIATNFVEALSGLGMAIAFVFWLIGFIEMVTEDRMSPEMFMKSFAKLGIAIGLCTYATEIMQAIVDFGNAFAKEVADITLTGLNTGSSILGLDKGDKGTYKVISIDGMNKDQYAAFLEKNNSMNFIGVFLLGGLISILILLASLAMQAVCYVVQITRILELCIRGAFLPVAFGLLADDGWRGAGGRYIKKFVAICSQGVVLVFIGKVTTYLMTSALAQGVSNGGELSEIFMGLFLVIAVGIASISVMFKSIGFVNDIFGA